MINCTIKDFQTIIIIPYIHDDLSAPQEDWLSKTDTDSVFDFSLYMNYVYSLLNENSGVCQMYSLKPDIINREFGISVNRVDLKSSASEIMCSMKYNGIYKVCFNTGVNFLIYDLSLTLPQGSSVDEYAELARQLRINIEDRIDRSLNLLIQDNDKECEFNKITNYLIHRDAVRNIISSPIKNNTRCSECIMINRIYTNESIQDNYKDDVLFWFAHGANSSFTINKNRELNGYDTICEYPYINWGLCSKGACCLVNNTQNDSTNNFLENVFCNPRRFMRFYSLIFILALHKKYALINFLNRIVVTRKNNGDYDYNAIKQWRRELVAFNVESSYSCISSERNYQNLYERYCEILSIEDIMDEIEQIIEEVELIETDENEKAEKAAAAENERLLNSIAALAIFSALTDSYDAAKRWLSFDSFDGEPVWVLAAQVIMFLIICSVIVRTVKSFVHKFIPQKKV